MQITTKYDIGTTVWSVDRITEERKTCPECRGHGYFRLRTGVRASCGACFGEGRREVHVPDAFRAKQTMVLDLRISISHTATATARYQVERQFSGGRDWHEERTLYATQLEAEVAAALAQDRLEHGLPFEPEYPETTEAVVEEAPDFTRTAATYGVVHVWLDYQAKTPQEGLAELRRILKDALPMATIPDFDVVQVHNTTYLTEEETP